ncbi:Ricin B lectin, partial [Terriglobus sp. YAF25]
IGRTYVYELLDEINSPGFGLVDGNMNPRPAYYAIRSLIGTLADPGPSFTPGTLPYAVTGGDSSLRKLLFQKRDGSFWLLLWSEQSSYDSVHTVYTPVTPQQVTLSLGGTYYTPSVGTFDTTGNLNWTNTDTASQTVPFTISDQITIVKILPR